MFSLPSLYHQVGMETLLDSHYDMIQEAILDSGSPSREFSPASVAEAKAVAASNSHKEAERRRRKRINGHIATLKSILSNTVKTDKASLLGEAVRRVKELKKTAAELALLNDDDDDDNTTTTSFKFTFPSETDELKIFPCEATGSIKAILSCDDRPEMIVDLIQAVKSAEAKVVRAEMSTVAGRTKMVLWVRPTTGAAASNDVGMGTLRRALKMVMDKSTLLAGSGQSLPGSKRPRCYHL